jgi:hypothetical protein
VPKNYTSTTTFRIKSHRGLGFWFSPLITLVLSTLETEPQIVRFIFSFFSSTYDPKVLYIFGNGSRFAPYGSFQTEEGAKGFKPHKEDMRLD